MITQVLINKTIYKVIDECGKECCGKCVCILQTFDYADGFKRQLEIWTNNYREVIFDDGGFTKTKFKEK